VALGSSAPAERIGAARSSAAAAIRNGVMGPPRVWGPGR
jgi:hypothetical protein